MAYQAAGYLCYCCIRDQLWTQQHGSVALSSISSFVVGSWMYQFQLRCPIDTSSLIVHCCHHVLCNWLEWIRLCVGIWSLVLTRTAIDGLEKAYKDARSLPVNRNIISSNINKPSKSPTWPPNRFPIDPRIQLVWPGSICTEYKSNGIQTPPQSIPMLGKSSLHLSLTVTTP